MCNAPEEKEPKLRDLLNLPIRNWYEVGKNLGIPEYDLEIINKNKDRDHEKTCKRKMFGLWITRYTKNPTYRAIVVALGESSEQKAVKFLCQSQGIDEKKCKCAPRDPIVEPERALGHVSVIYTGPDRKVKKYVEDIVSEKLLEDQTEELRQHKMQMKKLAPYFKQYKWGEVLAKLNYQYVPVHYYAKLDLGNLPHMNEIAPVFFPGGNFHVVCFNASELQRQRLATDDNNAQTATNAKESMIQTLKSILWYFNPCHIWASHSKRSSFDSMIVGSYEKSKGQLREVDNNVHQSIVSSNCDSSKVKYYKHREKKVVYPVNIQSQDPEEREHLKQSIITAIVTKVIRKKIPHSWSLFASIIWECRDQGIMKLPDCTELANECCIPNDQISLAMKCMHDQFGLFLYYHDVPKMDSFVILKPNLLVESISAFLNKVIKCIDSNWSIQKTGLVPVEMIHDVEQEQTLSGKCIPQEYTIELLKHCHLISEINGGRYFFMPLLLQEALEFSHFDDRSSSPAPVAIHFKDNKVPQVLFSALCTLLSQRWSLGTTHQFKNRMTFFVGQKELSKVEIVARSECIEVCILEAIHQLSETFCPSVVKTVHCALGTLRSTHHYMDGIEPNYQFFCPGSQKSGYLHFADPAGDCLICTNDPRCILSDEHYNQTFKIWKLDDKTTFSDDYSDQKEVDDIDDIMQQVEKHINEQGELNLRIVKTNFIGQPGVGKTTVCKRLVGKIENLSTTNSSYTSTGIEKPLTVHLFHNIEQQSVLIPNDEAEWSVQNIQEQLELLLQYMSVAPQKKSSTMPVKSPFLPRRATFHTDSDEEYSHQSGVLSKQEDSSDESETTDTNSEASTPIKSPSMKRDSTLSRKRSFKKSLTKKQSIQNNRQPKQPDFSHIREFISSTNWKKVKEIVESVVLDATILYITDTGGQPEFYEILPLLLQGPSFTVLFLKLTQGLNDPFSITYRQNSEEPSSVKYTSTFTTKEMLCQVLASVESLDSEERRSAAFIIATYKDKVRSQNDIDRLEHDVKTSIQDTSIFRRDVLRSYNTIDGANKLLYPIDNMNGDKEEITNLQRVLGNIIKQRFRKQRLPTSWGLFHLLLRHKFEQKGLCSLEECVMVAGWCGIAEDEVERILKYFHSNFGTILYYNEIISFRKFVICDPNALFQPVTKVIAESFAANSDSPQTAEGIRKTGEVPRDLIYKICQDDASQNEENDRLPLALILELLQHNHILTKLKPRSGSGHVVYFMPCLLSPDHSVNNLTYHDIQDLDPAPLVFSFSTGYLPIGLYSTLIVKLVHTNEWDLEPIRFKNKVRFIVDLTTITRVELISYFFGLAVHIYDAVHSHCLTVQRTLLARIREVMLQFPHMKNVDVGLSFYCPNRLPLHLANCKDFTSPKRMMCSNLFCSPQVIDLQQKHKIWFENYEEFMDTDTSPFPMSVGSDVSSLDYAKSGKVTLDGLTKILEDKSSDWDTIGRELGVKYNFRDSLRRDPCRKDISRLEAVLNEWIQSNQHPVTWEVFQKALMKMGFSDCARKVESIAALFEN